MAISYSQNRFIEVEVKDTIHIKASSLEYLIGLEDNRSLILDFKEKKVDEKNRFKTIDIELLRRFYI
jgi:hypothetical protein